MGDAELLTRGRSAKAAVRATALAYLTFRTEDLPRLEEYWTDFGLRVCHRGENGLHLRAMDSAPFALKIVPGQRTELAAVGLSVQNAADLQVLSAQPGSSPIFEHREPGGGQAVELTSPGGTQFVCVHGAQTIDAIEPSPPLRSNGARTKRRERASVCVPARPSEVWKLGHVVVQTPHTTALVGWLLDTLGLCVSEYQTLPGEQVPPIATFLRFDMGDAPADHHSLAVILGPVEQLDHVAFEVDSLDEVARGGEWMRQRGHSREWGIGRHETGSQIFDCWRGPGAFLCEHFADGDLLTRADPPLHQEIRASSIAQWGPPRPASFGVPPLTPGALLAVGRGLHGANDFTLRRLLAVVGALRR